MSFVKIGMPGVYSGIPMDIYHSADLCEGPSVSSSGLRYLIKESPAHYWDVSPLNPRGVERADTEAFRFGRAAHHLLLGEENFKKHFALRPTRFDSWRTQDARDWRAATVKAGLTVITKEQLDTIVGMAESLGKDPIIKAGALSGRIEQTIVAKDPVTGLWIKSRPDVIPMDSADFTDMKTISSVDDDMIDAAIGVFGHGARGYNMQAAMVDACWRGAFGVPMETFSLIFIEKSRPYCVRTVTLRPEDIDRGSKLNAIALRKVAHGLATGDWPGPGAGHPSYRSPKPWSVKMEDDLIILEGNSEQKK